MTEITFDFRTKLLMKKNPAKMHTLLVKIALLVKMTTKMKRIPMPILKMMMMTLKPLLIVMKVLARVGVILKKKLLELIVTKNVVKKNAHLISVPVPTVMVSKGVHLLNEESEYILMILLFCFFGFVFNISL